MAELYKLLQFPGTAVASNMSVPKEYPTNCIYMQLICD